MNPIMGRNDKTMKMRRRVSGMVTVLLLIGIDYATKLFAIRYLKGHENAVIVKNVLELEYFENFGAAFSSLIGKRILLIAVTLLVVSFLIWKLSCLPDTGRYAGMRFCILLLIGGAMGNLIDRIARGYVVDFIYFVPIDFPKFNFADMCVTCGVVLLGILLFFYYDEKELDLLLSFKK